MRETGIHQLILGMCPPPWHILGKKQDETIRTRGGVNRCGGKRRCFLLGCERLIGDINLNNDTRVNVLVQVWMVLLDKLPIGSGNFRSGAARVDS
jgi:hypothetical protein